MKKSNALMIVLFRILPQNLLSRLFGYITRIPVPRGILRAVIEKYSTAYGVKDEYITPRGGFSTFASFFTRTLKPGVRQIDASPKSVVSPVDARVDQYGKIEKNTIMQAKGIDYTLHDLVPSEKADQFINGSFMTLYLSPGDYHRIHTPVEGRVTGYLYVPGRLFTVQEYMVQGLKGLFTRNERITTFIDCGKFNTAICKVGAFNVGRISVTYDSVITNRFLQKKKEHHYSEENRVFLNKGDEVGTFHLGSTVILLFPENSVTFKKIPTGSSIQLGQVIAELV